MSSRQAVGFQAWCWRFGAFCSLLMLSSGRFSGTPADFAQTSLALFLSRFKPRKILRGKRILLVLSRGYGNIRIHYIRVVGTMLPYSLLRTSQFVSLLPKSVDSPQVAAARPWNFMLPPVCVGTFWASPKPNACLNVPIPPVPCAKAIPINLRP